MTLPEVAAYLSMSERTIYDWVQRGRIPAYKIGATWRFRRDEIDTWLVAQRTGPAAGAAGPACIVCSRPFTPDRPSAGTCEAPDCDTQICAVCWGPRGRRLCPAHASLTTRDAKPPAGVADSASQGSETDTLPLLKARFLDGFSGRIQIRPHLATAGGGVIGAVRNWDRVRRTSEGKTESTLHDRQARRRGVRAASATWQSVSYRVSIREGVLETAHRSLLIEARAIESATTRRRRREPAPVPAGVLTAMLESAAQDAREAGRHHVLGIYAPPGWDQAAVDVVSGSEAGKRFLSPNLSPALIGADLGTVVWNPSDPVIAELAHYVQATFEDEVAACRTAIRSVLHESDVYLLSRLVDEQGFTGGVARAAALAEEKAGELELTDEYGEEALIKKGVR